MGYVEDFADKTQGRVRGAGKEDSGKPGWECGKAALDEKTNSVQMDADNVQRIMGICA